MNWQLNVVDNTDDEYGQLLIEDQEGGCAAVIFNQEPGHPCSRERKDLARLLAAAPAMLDALREAKSELLELYSIVYRRDAGASVQDGRHRNPVIDKVMQVIASATRGY